MKNLFLFLALSCPIAFSGCKNFADPQYRSVKNFRLMNLSGKESTAKMDVVFYNPNNFGFQVKSSDLNIYINQSYAGLATLDSVIHVQKQTEFSIPISVRLSTQNLLTNTLALFLNKQVKVKIDGSIRAGKASIYKNFKVDYEGTQAIDF